MSKNIILVGFVVGIIFISGCIQKEKINPDVPVVQQDTDMQKFSQNEIQFTDMGGTLNCINTFDLRDKEFIITSNEIYHSLLQYKSTHPRCENFELPSIDFSQYRLLGKYAQGGGCSIDFVRKVFRDDSNKKIIYSIKVVEEGSCEKLGASVNWILIPKVPSDYSVEFQVK